MKKIIICSIFGFMVTAFFVFASEPEYQETENAIRTKTSSKELTPAEKRTRQTEYSEKIRQANKAKAKNNLVVLKRNSGSEGSSDGSEESEGSEGVLLNVSSSKKSSQNENSNNEVLNNNSPINDNINDQKVESKLPIPDGSKDDVVQQFQSDLPIPDDSEYRSQFKPESDLPIPNDSDVSNQVISESDDSDVSDQAISESDDSDVSDQAISESDDSATEDTEVSDLVQEAQAVVTKAPNGWTKENKLMALKVMKYFIKIAPYLVRGLTAARSNESSSIPTTESSVAVKSSSLSFDPGKPVLPQYSKGSIY